MGKDETDEDHEVADQLDIPVPGLANETRIHIVGGNRYLSQVVKEIIEQDLRGQHRQEWQEYGCCRHAEHVAEVRTRAHQEILHHISESLSALDDAVVKHLETALHQDDFCSVFRNIDRGRYRYADIRGVKRRRIVDAVTEVPHGVFARFQRQYDPIFLHR